MRLFLSLVVCVVLLTLVIPIGAQADDDPLRGTQWRLLTIADRDMTANSTITLLFGEDNIISGSGGCNGYSGVYALDGEALTVVEVASTLMACADGVAMDNEHTYLAAMQTATRYELGDDQLIIIAEADVQLVFVPYVSLPNTQWQLVSMLDEPVVGEAPLTLNFDTEGGFGGFGGCNMYGGTYSVDGSSISFGEIASTKMACADEALGTQEQAYFDALQHARGFSVDEGNLVIGFGRDGLLVFEPVLALENTAWVLETLNGADVLANSTITLEFGPEFAVRGTSGCNTYGGSYTLAGETITFDQLFMTEMACMETGLMEQEQVYLAALSAATAIEKTAEQLIITYGDGQQLVYGLALTISSWQ